QPPTPAKPPARRTPPRPPDRVLRLEVGTKAAERLILDAPVLTALAVGEREKRRPVALTAIPERVREAVLAIEDRRFYEHPGVDPIGIVGAAISNLRGKRAYTAGASTITQQVARNVFLPKMFSGMTLRDAREKSWRRKLLEAWVSLIIKTRASKDEILEMYLNDMTLGQRGSFGIVGVAEASRLFFGKDVSNVTLAESATIAGVYQSPSALSPFNNPARCKERRNVVLGAKADAALIALDPRTGEVLALVGGRSYNQSQYNRAVLSRRQPGSVFKPFVYLTAFEQAAKTGRTDVTPASITNDEQETFEFDDQVWTPENYEHEYDGPITFRRALAHSRNLGTIHVAQAAGYDKVAALWK